MPFKLCVVEKSLSTALVRTLEEFVTMDSVVLFK